MTDLLAKAFEAAARLPDDQQDALAAAILNEVESERRWDALFEGSSAQLARLADEALGEHATNKTVSLDERGS